MARGRHPHNFARAGGQAVAAAMRAAQEVQEQVKVGLNIYQAEALGEAEGKRVVALVEPADSDDNVVAYENRCVAEAHFPQNWEPESEMAYLRGFLRWIRNLPERA